MNFGIALRPPQPTRRPASPTDAAAVPMEARPRRRGWSRWLFLVVLWAGLMLCLAAAAAWVPAAARARIDPELLDLIRGMALLKGAAVLIAAVALSWRIRQPAATPVLIAAGAGLWAMAAGCALIWKLSAVGAGAACFHGGAIAVLVAAWLEARRGH